MHAFEGLESTLTAANHVQILCKLIEFVYPEKEPKSKESVVLD